MMIALGVALIGIIAGVMSGLFGIGGGIIIVPTLIAFLGMDILDANATSLAAMLLPVGILGVISYYKAGYIKLKDSLWISLGLLVGSYFGAELALSVDVHLLAKFYAAFLLYVAVSYLNIPVLLGIKKEEKAKEEVKPKNHSLLEFSVLGVFAGIIAGMFGKGGGIVIVPILTKFFKYQPKAATATSLAALQLPVGLPSVIVYAESGHLNLSYAALVAGGIVAGVLVGSKMAIKLPSATFKKIYALFLVFVAIFMVVKYL
jgi:Predicted permeases